MGGGIMALNFRAMRRLFEGALMGEGKRRAVAARYCLKFLCLLGAVLGVVLFLRRWVEPLAFLAGLFTFFLAVLIEGFRGYFQGR